MSKLDQLRELFPVGAIIECVENTYIQGRHGDAPQIITKAGKSFCDCTKDGEPYRMSLPTRACDVLALDDVSATYLLGDRRWREAHGDQTVTYRRIS